MVINLTSISRVRRLAEELRKAERLGADTDSPEGARYIQISDTLAQEIARELILMADSAQQASDLLMSRSGNWMSVDTDQDLLPGRWVAD